MSERTRGETVKRLLLLALWSVLLFPLSAADWTVLVYMAADNNLWQNAVADVNSMESVSLPANLNLIVQTDMPADSGYPGGQRRKIRPDNSPSITSPLLESLGTIDSGDPQTLASFANWGFQKYPSQRRMLVIWGHGDNWFKADEGKWICPDEGAQSLISVSDGELKEALSGLPRLDILLFDACSMQSLEVLAEVGQAADIVIASEELVPAAGFPYQTIVPLFADGGVEEIAGQIVEEYLESYLPGGIQNPYGFTNPITCSAVRTSSLGVFFSGFRDFFLSKSQYWPTSMLPIRAKCWEMGTGYNDIDVGELLFRMDEAWDDLLEPGLAPLKDKWKACVVASGSLNILHDVGSAAIWFPRTQQYYDGLWRRYAKLEFARYRWFQILHRVFGPHGKPPSPELVSQGMVLSNLRLELKQPDYPDSLWYIVKPRPWVEGSQAIFAEPEFGQKTFFVYVPVSGPGWLEIEAVNPWGAISDSLYVAYDYEEPGLELLVAPNPVRSRSLASAKWYLPEGSTVMVELKLFNSRGQKVLSRSFEQTEPGEGIWLLSAEPDFRKLGRGIFILSLKVGKRSCLVKLAIL